MIGDRIVPKPHHTRAANAIFGMIGGGLKGRRATLSIAGESGSGKSEIAVELERLFEAAGQSAYILHQDDYFILPPKTNERARMKEISRVGPGEVDIALLDRHVKAFRDGHGEPLTKPLVIFAEDRAIQETVVPAEHMIAIAEGTYTTLLENIDFRIFIDRTYEDTREHREERAREAMSEFYENVVKIEHEIISKHKARASLIVNKDYSVSAIDA